MIVKCANLSTEWQNRNKELIKVLQRLARRAFEEPGGKLNPNPATTISQGRVLDFCHPKFL